ncbi:uncharacterized protein HD556DRAFT_1325580 [Suillus plorans]|uniref:Zn(2)-C6 fungal-type domain-containing protein n=1 Tax=Suillus plorans TaxID=116603 RepID=A0A9P7DVY0_9AGAM|nr:uncharacterized protein HD556DRAFT_1325580 [Suillus plorans]KAG1804706.1 hypothetical protein HD556DRAFT_1325580 [Suillus plorans]
MSTFPIFHTLNSGAGFPGLSSYSAEQISLAPMEQPLYDQKAADLAALDLIPEDDWLKILGLQSSSAPGEYWMHVDSPPIAESDVQNDFTAAIRTKVSHPRVAHACDHCRRRKTKCSGEQPVCTSCKKRGKVCQWTPIKTTKERRSRKPYDVGSEYRPRPSTSAPYIVAPRATYPSVMLPNPMTIWSIEDAMSAAQASTISNASSSRSELSMQTPTGWSPRYDSDCDVEWIPSPSSSCLSLGSDDSSRESSPLDTPTPDPIYFSGEEPAQDIDDFFKDLYQALSPEWSSVLQSWPEMPFAQ